MTLLHFTASDGARLAYRDEGEGLPVLCLAGLTRSSTDFDFLASHLPDVRLIRADYRGRGGSEWTGAATYTVPREAKDALELLDHLGLEQAAVIGTSRGGLIAMVLAATARPRSARADAATAAASSSSRASTPRRSRASTTTATAGCAARSSPASPCGATRTRTG